MPAILAINLEIGFGHPNYLDYVVQAVKNKDPEINVKYWDVLSQEQGLPKYFWQLSKKIYTYGSQGGFLTKFYNKFRATGRGQSLTQLCLIQTKKQITDDSQIILVSHPILARSLVGRIWYLHAEIALPQECVCNVEKIVVPLEQTQKKLISYGISAEHILQSGLIIAPDLVSNVQENFIKRITRFHSPRPLTIGFFISGAYPRPHIQKIIAGIVSAKKENHRIIAFIGIDRKKGRKFINQLHAQLQQTNHSTESPVLFIQGKHRNDYQKRINRLFPLLDVFVATSHELTNWAMGLGLPMFVLFPMIGTYAEENFRFAEKQGVVYPLTTITKAQQLGKIIAELRQSGILQKMAENGLGKFPINGAITTAQTLIDLIRK